MVLKSSYRVLTAAALGPAGRNRQNTQHWWITLLQGLAGIGAGIVTFLWPGITALALLVSSRSGRS